MCVNTRERQAPPAPHPVAARAARAMGTTSTTASGSSARRCRQGVHPPPTARPLQARRAGQCRFGPSSTSSGCPQQCHMCGNQQQPLPATRLDITTRWAQKRSPSMMQTRSVDESTHSTAGQCMAAGESTKHDCMPQSGRGRACWWRVSAGTRDDESQCQASTPAYPMLVAPHMGQPWHVAAGSVSIRRT